jgi:uncharacterized membrane protein
VNSQWIVLLTFVSAIGCALNAGVFFAFSSFVMKALARLPAAQGIAAMNSINVAAVTPAFMTALFGTGAACLVLAVRTPFMWHQPGAAYVLAGAVLYLVGTILVTLIFNVPRNDALARVNPSSGNANAVWSEYVRSWTLWNHVRTISALTAAALLTIGLCRFQR